ncbi:hypothetical protein C2E23DRAFT_821821 [Lenzites betulinus]|nr:hypothetical protein C2E23DRAFT_843139 [Lenzites betulinus]KAH9853555.1 hypothetical protein C2E23DRAFT_821821 [Lenzites betulinus]
MGFLLTTSIIPRNLPICPLCRQDPVWPWVIPTVAPANRPRLQKVLRVRMSRRFNIHSILFDSATSSLFVMLGL